MRCVAPELGPVALPVFIWLVAPGLDVVLAHVPDDAAAERGARALKAITGPQNEGSILFHRKLGFEMTHIDDYGGTGRVRLIMRRPLKDFPLSGLSS